ncbi:MFS transporter [Actinokineospora bangkokensis]|uniref:Major facilitator superfamily (MFS) profile domain-containing protein n=1 Tax=Actinokineospora bangkokensis TaxID=1193682 RepID=A0A1Q9LGC0_9PSEU|nr:MFS transporter [Actinokineospora bangkokensis]OLR91088.1 hypothetical protein BJP25_31640 [Actinokineospora bangkokensis]
MTASDHHPDRGPHQGRGRPRPGLWALVVATAATGTSGHAVAGLLPTLATSLHTTAAAIGQLATVFGLVCGLAAPVLAVATTRLDRRTLLTGCLLVTATGNTTAALATTYPALLAGRVITALGAALATASAVTLAAATTAPPHRAKAVALVLTGVTLALLAGVPVVAAISYHAGHAPALWSVVALCLLAATLVATLAPTTPPS